MSTVPRSPAEHYSEAERLIPPPRKHRRARRCSRSAMRCLQQHRAEPARTAATRPHERPAAMERGPAGPAAPSGRNDHGVVVPPTTTRTAPVVAGDAVGSRPPAPPHIGGLLGDLVRVGVLRVGPGLTRLPARRTPAPWSG
jgi:hypothetical protein